MGATQSTSRYCVLKTLKGSLKGIELLDKSGKAIYQRFTRVPFAQPPVGPLRWRRPQPLPADFTFSSSASEPGDFSTFGPICPQPVYTHNKAALDNPTAAPAIENTQDEDCLYLNIWIPSGPPPRNGWPIQFFIHGGWLQVGDAMQDHSEDPFDLLSSTSHPRIIISPTYRLNVFGFLTSPVIAECAEDPAPGNYGFWDQRAALEWTAANISLFGGDPTNITVGGLSAGANSAFFQLYYDTYLPPSERLIKRVYLYSNAVGIQPASATSSVTESQFNSLCTALSIPTSLPPHEILSQLRSVPFATLIDTLHKLDYHTFRASTDASFIAPSFLASLHSGAFTTKLAENNTSIMLGEVAHEARLYRLVNPPSDFSSLRVQLQNYYPAHVVDALLDSTQYTLPNPETASSDDWADIYATIVADCQVHAVIRGFAHSLLSPPRTPGIKALTPAKVHRYRISWRAKSLDEWILPAVGVCHAADIPIWWASGWRAGYTESDKEKVREWLEPFGRFIYGEDEIGWGTEEMGETAIRLFDSEGAIRIVKDDLWEGRMGVWAVMWEAQRERLRASL
jgi:carboxylesterase type B